MHDLKTWQLSAFLICIYVSAVITYNIDVENYSIYNGTQDSNFGFNISFGLDGGRGWLIVDAPTAQSSFEPQLYRQGAIYRCPPETDGNCMELPLRSREIAEQNKAWKYSIDQAVISSGERGEQDHMDYATVVGNFLDNGGEAVAVGVPDEAKVLLFSRDLRYRLEPKLTSDQMESYFGYSLAASDVDGDGKVDLIVGAPAYTVQNDKIGQVVVIYQHNITGRFTSRHQINGFRVHGMFGYTVASLGDINQDGYGDFAVGAPFDGPYGRGGVYIYHGSKFGVRDKYSQVIYAEDLGRHPGNLKRFGHAIVGGVDVDNNLYPDVAVSAYLSDKVFFFRSQPVIIVDASVHFMLPNKIIDIQQPGNFRLRDGIPVTTLQIQFCMSYTGKGVPPVQAFNVQYILDQKKVFSRMGFLKNETISKLNDTLVLNLNEKTCKTWDVYVKNNMADKITPLVVQVKYSVKDNDRIYPNYPHVRNPRSILKPALDVDTPPIKRDWIRVKTNCAQGSICDPQLSLTVTPNVQSYSPDSGEPLILNTVVSNSGVDAFDTTLEVKYSDNIAFEQAFDETVIRTSTLCTDDQMNRLVRCRIANTIQQNGIARFQLLWRPNNYQKRPSYDFVVSIKSTSDDIFTRRTDSSKNISIPVTSYSTPNWPSFGGIFSTPPTPPTFVGPAPLIDNGLRIDGWSSPTSVSYSSIPDYNIDISQHSYNTPEHLRLSEEVIGPVINHEYVLKNGPNDIEEGEVTFAWPAHTLTGEDLVYLLEPPDFSNKNFVRCEQVPANYRNFRLLNPNRLTNPLWSTTQAPGQLIQNPSWQWNNQQNPGQLTQYPPWQWNNQQNPGQLTQYPPWQWNNQSNPGQLTQYPPWQWNNQHIPVPWNQRQNWTNYPYNTTWNQGQNWPNYPYNAPWNQRQNWTNYPYAAPLVQRQNWTNYPYNNYPFAAPLTQRQNWTNYPYNYPYNTPWNQRQNWTNPYNYPYAAPLTQRQNWTNYPYNNYPFAAPLTQRQNWTNYPYNYPYNTPWNQRQNWTNPYNYPYAAPLTQRQNWTNYPYNNYPFAAPLTQRQNWTNYPYNYPYNTPWNQRQNWTNPYNYPYAAPLTQRQNWTNYPYNNYPFAAPLTQRQNWTNYPYNYPYNTPWNQRQNWTNPYNYPYAAPLTQRQNWTNYPYNNYPFAAPLTQRQNWTNYPYNYPYNTPWNQRQNWTNPYNYPYPAPLIQRQNWTNYPFNFAHPAPLTQPQNWINYPSTVNSPIIQIFRSEVWNAINARYPQQQFGGERFSYRCITRQYDGQEQETSCGPNFALPVSEIYSILQHSGVQQAGNIQYKCFEKINSFWKAVDCQRAPVSLTNQPFGTRRDIIKKCRIQHPNGQWQNIECNDRLKLSGLVIEEKCYQLMNGGEYPVSCDMNQIYPPTGQYGQPANFIGGPIYSPPGQYGQPANFIGRPIYSQPGQYGQPANLVRGPTYSYDPRQNLNYYHSPQNLQSSTQIPLYGNYLPYGSSPNQISINANFTRRCRVQLPNGEWQNIDCKYKSSVGLLIEEKCFHVHNNVEYPTACDSLPNNTYPGQPGVPPYIHYHNSAPQPIRYLGSTPHTPYAPYTPHTPYAPYTPHTPYTPYSPYSPYTPYPPYNPYQQGNRYGQNGNPLQYASGYQNYGRNIPNVPYNSSTYGNVGELRRSPPPIVGTTEYHSFPYLRSKRLAYNGYNQANNPFQWYTVRHNNIKCTIRNIQRNAEIKVNLRGRLNVRVFKNVPPSQPITVSSAMTFRINNRSGYYNNLPFFNMNPPDGQVFTREVHTTVSKQY